MTTTVLNVKIGGLENKMSDTSGSVTTTALNTKLEKFRTKYQMVVA